MSVCLFVCFLSIYILWGIGFGGGLSFLTIQGGPNHNVTTGKAVQNKTAKALDANVMSKKNYSKKKFKNKSNF